MSSESYITGAKSHGSHAALEMSQLNHVYDISTRLHPGFLHYLSILKIMTPQFMVPG